MAWTLLGIVFCWQLPHAMAIAWLYRQQYALAEVKLATVVDPSGRAAGWLAVAGAAALLPVSLLPAIRWGHWEYGEFALLWGAIYLAWSISFLRDAREATARRLFWWSLFYLPAVLIAMLVSLPR